MSSQPPGRPPEGWQSPPQQATEPYPGWGQQPPQQGQPPQSGPPAQQPPPGWTPPPQQRVNAQAWITMNPEALAHPTVTGLDRDAFAVELSSDEPTHPLWPQFAQASGGLMCFPWRLLTRSAIGVRSSSEVCGRR